MGQHIGHRRSGSDAVHEPVGGAERQCRETCQVQRSTRRFADDRARWRPQCLCLGHRPKAAQKGIYASDQLPQLLRKDFVQHSNDSAWLANPAQPLTGFSPLISQDGQPLGLRSRFALERLGALAKAGPVTAADLQQMVMDDQVYQAAQVMPDLLQWCSADAGADADAATLAPVCASLKTWDGHANLDSGLGFVHFQNVMQSLQQLPDLWRVAFDPADAQHTPRGLALDRPSVSAAIGQALLASVE